jgi:tRNA-specific 2-thiouridylase
MSGRDRIVIAMSGGVDSSVAAALLAEQGYEVIGITLDMMPRGAAVDSGFSTRSGATGIADAARVCEHLGIAHHVVDVRDPFERLIIREFVEEYVRGRTPNPCIRCNQDIKFQTLRDKARELGARWLATGHYARIGRVDATYHLLRGVDRDKDQSYFLYTLTQDQMACTLFPNGDRTKAQVRAKAAELGLAAAEGPESQDACFVSEGGYARLIAQYSPSPEQPGDIVHIDGAVLGRHQGISRYTIGQRRGLGIAWSEPLYAVAIDPGENRVVVGPDEALWGKEFAIEGANFAPDVPERAQVDSTCRVRRNMADATARLVRLGPDTAQARFDEPVRAITPGQAAVFYDGERVLGGGKISEVIG